MAIVAIARERGAMGETIAEALAKKLGYRFLNKRLAEERLEALGMPEKRIVAYDEKKPGFFATFTSAMDDYIRCLKYIIYDEAEKGNCVFLGRGSQYLFQGIPGAVTVRLVAPFDVRVKRIMDHYGLDQKLATREVRRIDSNREQFNEHFFETSWKNPSCYDLVVNTKGITPDSVVAIIIKLLEERVTPDDVIKGQIAVGNLATAQAVVRHILHELKLPVFFLEAECSGKEVTLSGIAHSVDTIERACQAAKIPGIKKVHCNITIGRLST